MSKSRKLIRKYYPYVVLGGAFLALLFWNAFYLENWLDSDMAAEMMFSKLLAEKGKVFADTGWYYSTEFRFLYTHPDHVPAAADAKQRSHDQMGIQKPEFRGIIPATRRRSVSTACAARA